jgi:single-strand DNA-binding protein
MSDMNVCTFIGRVTRDAETQMVGAKNTSLTKWGIANNTGYGQYERTQFFNCQMWGRQGEAMKQYLVKGKQVCVTGQLEDTSWVGNDDVKHQQWTLTVSQISLLADARNAVQQQVAEAAGGPTYSPDGNSVF